MSLMFLRITIRGLCQMMGTSLNDEDLELHLKGELNFSLINNNFDVDLEVGKRIWVYNLILISIRQ